MAFRLDLNCLPRGKNLLLKECGMLRLGSRRVKESGVFPAVCSALRCKVRAVWGDLLF